MAAVVLGVAASFVGVVFFEAALIVNGFLAAPSTVVSPFLIVLSPVGAGIFCAWLAKGVKGGFQGLADTIVAARCGRYLTLKDGLLSSLAALASFGGGASVGLYGPIAHLGGLLSNFSKRVLAPDVGAACGVAAAIAAVFNAPITGLIFAQEVVLRRYSLRTFTPLAISSVVGYAISAGLLERPAFLQIGGMAEIKPWTVLLFALQGILFGAVAAFYTHAIFAVNRLSSSVSLLWRLSIAGAITGVLTLMTPQIAGSGRELLVLTVDGFFGDWQTVTALTGVKIVATVLCLGVGFAGGIVSPTLVIGALLGFLFGTFIEGVPIFVSVVCGMMALTAPVIGAPLAGVLFVLELSGNYSISIAAAVSIAISTYTAARLGGGSFYDRQLQEQGVDITVSKEMMLMEGQSVGAWAVGNFVSLPDTETAKSAECAMIEKQADECFIIDADECYIGSLRLPVAAHMAAIGKGDALLAELAESPQEFLYADENLAAAMKKIAEFSDGWVAVLRRDGTLIGGLSEIIIMRAYFAAVQKLRDEDEGG